VIKRADPEATGGAFSFLRVDAGAIGTLLGDHLHARLFDGARDIAAKRVAMQALLGRLKGEAAVFAEREAAADAELLEGPAAADSEPAGPIANASSRCLPRTGIWFMEGY
jgi:hypothetical protein